MYASCTEGGGAPRALDQVGWVCGMVRAMERLARRLARQHGAPWMADDLAQIGLELACRLAATYDPGRGAFATYVYAYARGAMLNALTHEQTQRARVVPGGALAPDVALERALRLDAQPDDAPSAEDRLVAAAEAQGRAALLARCLRELAPTERRLVEECLLRGRPVSAVSAEVGLGVRTAGRRLGRIVERIRRAGRGGDGLRRRGSPCG